MPTAKALEGIKVADFTWVVAGPTTTSCLGDYGATVVKVESHTHPDTARTNGPFKGGRSSLDSSGYYVHQNSSKYGISLNLAKEKARDVALRLAAWADVVVESMTPGAMKRLGLDYENACKVNPNVIYVSISTHGQYGPRCLSPGYGQLASALTGIWYLSGWPDRGPTPPEGAYIDYVTPKFCILAIMAALDYRRRTGKGQYIDITLTETGIQFVAPAIMDYLANRKERPRKGSCLVPAVPHGAFPCRGKDEWVAIGVHTDAEWKALCRAMGSPLWVRRFSSLRSRQQNEEELERLVGAWTLNYTPTELADMLQAEGVPASIVEHTRDLFDDAQLKHRGHFRTLQHSVIGPYLHDARAFRLSRTPDEQTGAPALGENNVYVYKELLGLSDEQIGEMLAEGIITTENDLPSSW